MKQLIAHGADLSQRDSERGAQYLQTALLTGCGVPIRNEVCERLFNLAFNGDDAEFIA